MSSTTVCSRALVLAVFSCCLACAAHAQAPAEGILRPSWELELQLSGRSAAQEVASHTRWTLVGHSHANHAAGGANPWNVYTGTWDPGPGTATSAQWDFGDQTALGAGDSLQGWWPVTLPYRYAPFSTMTDDQRPWCALDHGNQLNARPVGAAHPRTFGVVSAWHADPGNAAGAVRWAPLSGSRSMWCGLRALGDATVLDPVTHQPYNEQAVQFNGWAANTAVAPAFRNYPGYGNQWDQMLYRDFTPATGASMNVAFLYATRLSTGFATGVTERTGWFHGDPLSLAPGNFISASAAGANAPRDSFSVYIGVPVDDANCAYSDGSYASVFDPQRRWFAEVIRLDAPWFELLGQAGAAPADTLAGPLAASFVVPWADPGNGGANVAAIAGSARNPSHRVRLVFRVKTNRTFSDEDGMAGNGAAGLGFGSDGRGAVLLDDVTVDGATYGFEGEGGGVDNALDAAGHWVTATTACWKTTGKPPASYVHAVDVTTVTWNDLCGLPYTSTSVCGVEGTVASVGNADQFGSIADSRWASLTEWVGGMVSPTVDLVTNPDGITPNEMGLTRTMTACTEDLYLVYELDFAAFALANSGTLWNFGVQSYPVRTASGRDGWSDIVGSPTRYYQGYPGCSPDLAPLKSNGLVRTSRADGVPDSIRVYLGITSECFYFGGTCNTTDGGYFDNVALVFANRAGATGADVGTLRADIWQFFCDAFPVNGYAADNVAAGTLAFDTTTALVKGPVNTAASTGDANRADVLADSIVVCAPNGTGTSRAVRVDLVFRILPGPGNYKAVAGRTFPPTTSMQLLRVPTDTLHTAVPGDGSFWGQYLANNGAFGSYGGAGHPRGKWGYLVWNSARCDTLETNLFPVVGHASGGVDPEGGLYQSTYHESDPHFEALGIPKGRCFLVDPGGPANSTNIACDTTLTKTPGALLGDWPLSPASGFDGRFSTKEYTKIIPDGLLTPGSHVQYFFRKQLADGTGGVVLLPDTNTICPQRGEANFDGHRWQHFGVLPDRWKGTEFGGPGMACMLYVDNDDRRGDERAWVSVMDTIGGTAPTQWGAQNGWHAPGDGFGLDLASNPNVSQAFVNRNRQPGTVADAFGVKASESGETGGAHLGSRCAPQPTGFMTGKGAAIGPRKSWLRAYYRMVTWCTGSGNRASFGPVTNVGEDDIGLVEDFLVQPAGTARPRQLLVQGDGFAEQCDANGGVHLAFLNNYLFSGLRDMSYTDLTPSLVSCPDLIGDPTIFRDATLGTNLVYGVVNDCVTLNDVLDPAPTESRVAVSYQPAGVNAPYRAGIEHPASTAYNWHSILLGFDMAGVRERYCGSGCWGQGRANFYYELMANAFGAACGAWVPGGPIIGGCRWTPCGWWRCGDVPVPPADAPADFLRIGNSVVRTGDALLRFGAAAAGHVRLRVYDLGGRRVRTLVDADVEPGERGVRWDGRDDAGNPVRHGVYFARIEYAGGKRLGGRVIFLR